MSEDIPPPMAHTALAMDEAIVAKARGGDSSGVPMSAATSSCDREIWYGFRWAAPLETPTGQQQRRVRTGLQYERWLLDDLRTSGVEVREVDEQTGKQFAVRLADGHLRGKVDGIALGLVEASKTEHVAECKSMKAADFRAVIKHGLAKAKPDHWMQVQLYMHGLGLTRAIYICANKDTDEIHTVRVEYDTTAALGAETRIGRIVDLPTPPAKVSDDPEAFSCKFCKAKAICHAGAWPRNNCRTCMFSTPGPAGTWNCERRKILLDWKAMQAGCGEHRFIPDLVPGTQIDVILGDKVVYEMPDGSHWIDGGEVAA